MAHAGVADTLGGWYRHWRGRPRQGRQLPLAHARLGSDYGGYAVLLERLTPDSIVYSFGLGEDISFDLELIGRVGCEVFAFDPTPRSLAWVRAQEPPPALRLSDVGLADRDGTATFSPPDNPAHISHSLLAGAGGQGARTSFEVRRLSTLLAERGHARLDLLKMDIEGAEYGVIRELCASSLRPGQIAVEFHHGIYGIPLADTERALDELNGAGYRIFDAQASGREFSLVLR